MRPRSTLQNAASTLAGQVTARLLALALYAVLARHFGPGLYGDMGLGTAFGALFVVFIEPGLNPLLIKDGAVSPERLAERFAETLGYKLVSLCAVWPVMVAAAWLMGLRGLSIWAVLFSGGTLLLVAFEDFGAAVLTARERMDLEGTLRACSKLVFTAAGLGAVVCGARFEVILAALTCAQLCTAGVMLVLVKKSGVPIRVHVDARRAWTQVARAWPLALTGVLWMITLRLDQVLATLLGVSRAALGDYNGAVKLVEALILFPSSIALTFAPVLSRAFVEGHARCAEELGVGLEVAFSACVPVALGGALLAGPIAVFVYGAGFSGTGPLLALQLLALPLIAVQFLSSYALIAAGALRTQALIVAINLGTNVVANLLLVPRLGIVGATWAALAGGAAASVACVAFLAAYGLRPRWLKALWRPAICGLGMAALVFELRGHLPFWASIAVGGAGYLVGFVLLGGLGLLRALQQRRAIVDPIVV